MVSDVYQSVANESTGGITIPHWPSSSTWPSKSNLQNSWEYPLYKIDI